MPWLTPVPGCGLRRGPLMLRVEKKTWRLDLLGNLFGSPSEPANPHSPKICHPNI
jgi:hypothetical protein